MQPQMGYIMRRLRDTRRGPKRTRTTKRTKKMDYENNGEIITLGRITTITALVMAAIAVLAVLNV